MASGSGKLSIEAIFPGWKALTLKTQPKQSRDSSRQVSPDVSLVPLMWKGFRLRRGMFANKLEAVLQSKHPDVRAWLVRFSSCMRYLFDSRALPLSLWWVVLEFVAGEGPDLSRVCITAVPIPQSPPMKPDRALGVCIDAKETGKVVVSDSKVPSPPPSPPTLPSTLDVYKLLAGLGLEPVEDDDKDGDDGGWPIYVKFRRGDTARRKDLVLPRHQAAFAIAAANNVSIFDAKLSVKLAPFRRCQPCSVYDTYQTSWERGYGY